MPKVHPRHFIMANARYEITDAINKAVKEHELTYCELTSILAGEIVSWSGWQIRDERREPGDTAE